MPSKKHYEVALVTPNSLKAKRKRVIRCLDPKCGLKYSVKDYTTLYENKKLMYFDASSILVKSKSIICHDCLFRHILLLTGNKVAKVAIINPDSKTAKICNFYPRSDKKWLSEDE
tara:strand:- start:461 stop:805 length:345 start_codon:yes stop_codon:yes gene_type:complete